MLALTSTQQNQINAFLRLLRITNTSQAHPDWPIWVAATKIYEQQNKLQAQIKQQDATIKQLQNDIERLNNQVTNVARNAAVSKKHLI